MNKKDFIRQTIRVFLVISFFYLIGYASLLTGLHKSDFQIFLIKLADFSIYPSIIFLAPYNILLPNFLIGLLAIISNTFLISSLITGIKFGLDKYSS